MREEKYVADLKLALGKVGVKYEDLVNESGELSVGFKLRRLGGNGVTLVPSYVAVELILKTHPDLKGKFSYDTLKRQCYFNGKPIDKDQTRNPVLSAVESKLGTVSIRNLDLAIESAAKENPQSIIVRMFDVSIKDSNVGAIQELVTDVLGLTDANTDGNLDLYVRLMQNFLVSMIARVKDPGCKVDTALVLHGPEKLNAGEFMTSLIPKDLVFRGEFDIKKKSAYIACRSHIAVDITQCLYDPDGYRVALLRSFMSCDVDMYRPPYGKSVTEEARRAVLFAVTSEDKFLHDRYGNRRFYVIPVKKRINPKAVERIRHRALSEALAIYEAHKASKPGSAVYVDTRWWLDNDDAMEERRAALASRHNAF